MGREGDIMKLRELADELKKIFDFKYITVSKYNEYYLLVLYDGEHGLPTYDEEEERWNDDYSGVLQCFLSKILKIKLDLNEYVDEYYINFSKYIVEV